MNFHSYYTKVIFTLAGIFLLLFLLLGIIDGLLIKHSVAETLSSMQKRRIDGIFKELNRLEGMDATDAKIQIFVRQLILEFQMDIYDNTGRWVAGNELFYKAAKSFTKAVKEGEEKFLVLSVAYTNPVPSNRYAHILISWESEEKPIFKKVILLLIISGLITVLTAFMVGWKLSASLNKWLNVLQRGVGEIERGNFDVRINIEGQDEIAQLGNKFNRMAQQIRDLIKQLEESNTARRRLIAHATHEMKSPITSIKGFVDIVDYLNLINDAPHGQQLLTTVRKDITRMVKITDDLVQLAKYQEPGFSLEMRKISLIEFIKEEHGYFEYKAHSMRTKAVLNLPDKKSLFIQADNIRLGQVLDNLWSNALKYGNAAQPIETTVSISGEQVEVSIRNALEFPMEIAAQQLFEPFYRHPKHAEKIEGAGLGLAIVKELVEKMNGQISADFNDDQLIVTTYWKLAPEK